VIKWLFEKLIGWPWCVHKWAIIDQRKLSVRHDYGSDSTGQRFYLQCSRCGDVKKRDLA
jgi:hypothetical protein